MAHLLLLLLRLSGASAEIIGLTCEGVQGRDLINCRQSGMSEVVQMQLVPSQHSQSDWRRPLLHRSVSQLSIISPKRHLEELSVVVPGKNGQQWPGRSNFSTVIAERRGGEGRGGGVGVAVKSKFRVSKSAVGNFSPGLKHLVQLLIYDTLLSQPDISSIFTSPSTLLG